MHNINTSFVGPNITHTIKNLFPIIQTSSYMKQQWQTVPLKIEGNTAIGELPSEAVGAYKDVVFIKDGKKIVVSTEYIEK